MFLQNFFFVTNLMGWWRWANPKEGEEDRKKELKVSFMMRREFILVFGIGLIGTFLFGTFAKNLHEWFPTLFSLPSAYPYADSFVTTMSIVTTFLMIQKKVECWIIWIIVDAVATYLYFAKGIKFVGIEYLVFCFLAAFGLWNWIQEYKANQVSITR
jgi:nicotinamide mononucleotide transporter